MRLSCSHANELLYCCVPLFVRPLHDLTAAVDAQLVRAERPVRAALLIISGTVATWWAYVPLHELLHALACWLTGGTVTELQIAPEYGGAIFAQLLPFVVSGGTYAGRLSGFDTHGSDLIYLATDAMPFLLTILVGVPLLQACAGHRRPLLFGTAVVVALAPFYCLIGDYYEMGSILVTRAFASLQGAGEGVPFVILRSDDALQTISTLWYRPETLQLHSAEALATAVAVIAASLVLGFLLACATYALGAWWARLSVGR
ncbi:MAG: hypothetical protein ACE5I7_14665 [Candidatus Binatia bacterium]